MSQQNTVLIDDIMSALDAESSQNVELIVRNTQNGATRKMALSSLESIIYSYLTSSSVASQLASVLGGWRVLPDLGNDINGYVNQTGVIGLNPNRTNAPFTYGVVLCFANKSTPNYSIQIAFNVSSSGKPVAFRVGTGLWRFFDISE